MFSVFAKADTRTIISLVGNAASTTGYFDLSVGTATGTGASIVSVGNGWYRCVLAFTSAFTGATSNIIYLVSTGTTISYTGDGTSGAFIWGAQFEQRSAVTAYTPTTTQAITNYIPVLLTAASGVPRFDHNPISGDSLGFLVEEQRTNLVTYSSEFDNAAWTKNAVAISANTIIAPDGTLTGDKLTVDSTLGAHGLYEILTVSASTAHTGTVYLKRGDYQYGYISLFGTGSTYYTAVFDLNNGTLSSTNGSSTSTSITSVGNGWYRVSLTVNSASTTGVVYIGASNAATLTYSGGVPSYTGNGVGSIYIWGAQLEAGGFATSYIATVASQVTRAADAASMTGTNFSSWYNAGQWTAYAEATSAAVTLNSTVFSISDGTGSTTNKINVDTGSNIRTFNYSNGVNNYILSSLATISNNSMFKVATAVAANDVAATANGNTVKTSSAMTLMPLNIIRLSFFDNNYLNGTIKKFAYYPRRLSNEELQEMTS